jgi:hypothetical protein
MKIEITLGPVTLLKVVMFEPTEEVAEPDILEIIHKDQDGDDPDRRLRGGND